jgi:outer membrane protein TolC
MMVFSSRYAQCCFFLVFAACSFVAVALAAAQEPAVITLEQALELALNADAGLKQSAVTLGLAKTKTDNLWAQVFPSISLGGGINHNITVAANAPSQNTPNYSLTGRLSLSLNAGIPYTMKSIRLAYQQGLLDMESARRQIKLQTSKTFYTLIVQEQNLSVLENTKKFAEDQLTRDTTAWRSGSKGELDYQQGRLSAESARFNHERALDEYRNALADFRALLGLDETRELRPSGEITVEKIVPDAERLAAAYLPQRPDIASLRGKVEQLEADQKQKTLSAKAPSLSLSASWGTQAAKDFKWEADKTVSTGITLSIPLNPWIPHTKENQELDAASADIEKARIALRDTEDKARRSIQSMCASLQTRWNETELSRLQVEIAERVYTLSEEAYRRGSINFLDFEATRDKLTTARQQLLTTKLNYKLLVIDLASGLNIDEAELRGVP